MYSAGHTCSRAGVSAVAPRRRASFERRPLCAAAYGGHAMAVDELKQRILELLAVWSREDAARLGDFYHPDVVYHGLPYGFPPGLAGAAQFYRMSRGAFPDLRYAPSHLIRDGDMVAVRITAQGTQRGLYLGYAPTGRFARWTGSQIFTFRGDKIAEVWSI